MLPGVFYTHLPWIYLDLSLRVYTPVEQVRYLKLKCHLLSTCVIIKIIPKVKSETCLFQNTNRLILLQQYGNWIIKHFKSLASHLNVEEIWKNMKQLWNIHTSRELIG